MVGRLQPLVNNQRIVGADGFPTEYFIRWAQQRQIDIGNAVSEERAIEIITAFFEDNPLLAGSGIGLTPSGNILDGVTISAEAQEILDQIDDTHGAILFRGASAWEVLAPGTAGYFLKTNGPGADPEWAEVSGGGGTTPIIRATRPAIFLNSDTVVVPWPTGTLEGDTVFIFTAHGWNAIDPSGWTVLRNDPGSFINGAVYQKVMTAGDISAGSVTINYGGFFAGTVQAVTIIGSAVSVRSVNSDRSSAVLTSVPFNSGTTANGDLLIGYFGNRANSVNTLPAGWTSLADTQNADASSVFGSLVSTSTSYSGTASATDGGSGYYTAILSLTE